MGDSEQLMIDSHVHVLPPRRLRGLVRWLKKAYPDHPVSEEITAAELLADLQAAGVTHFFNLAYPLGPEETDELNQFNFQFCSSVPGAIPFASLHPETPAKARCAEKALAQGAVGFKFHPFVQGFDPWDSRMEEFYRFVEEAGRPVLLHTGFELFYGKLMPGRLLIELVKCYPRLPWVFAHMAFPELELIFEAMADYPDLYVDATNVLACFRPAYHPMLKMLGSPSRLLDSLLYGLHRCAGRIMFGSDHPAGMGSYSAIWEDVEILPAEEEIKNALRFGAAQAFISRFWPDFDWSKRLSAPA